MRKSNNGNPPTLVQQGRAARTTYGRWALDDAALEVMDDAEELLRVARSPASPASVGTTAPRGGAAS